MLTVIAALAVLAAHPPARLAPAVADSIRAAIERDRDDTRNWLKTSKTSYLATIVRRDFGDRATLTLGRDPACDVRVDAPELAPRHLNVTVVGDSFLVEAGEPRATFTVRDSAMSRALLPPGNIGVGRYTVRLSHQRFPALIVFDINSPRYADYKGLDYFPVDLAYRFELPLTPAPRPDTVVIASTRGNLRRALRAGWFEFRVGGKAQRLEAVRLLEPGVGERDLGVFFRDATSGRTTYELGRYVDALPLADGRYVLDFNLAYNPACAFSEHYNCPIPPRANRLKVAIPAGEKDSHYH